MNFQNLLGKQVFKTQKLQSVSIFPQFVHLFPFLYLLCYLYLLVMFWAVQFMFHSVWWRSLLFEFAKFRGTAPSTKLSNER